MTGEIFVLHVDDEPGFAEMTGEFLKRENDRIDVRTATSADEGLEIAAAHDVDCIISDYEMPGENGIEFLEAVRKEHPDLPFILYTGRGSEEVASEATSAGVTDYLQKESGTDQYTLLANRIKNAVEQTRAEREREQMRERMELALEHTDSLIFEIDLETEEVIRHGAFEQFFDLPTEEVPTYEDHLERVVHPDDRETFQQFYRQILDGDRDGGTVEYRTNPDFGRVRWIEDTVSVESGSATETPQAVGIARDITDRKRREEEFRRKQRRYQAVFNDPNILVGLLDTDGTVLDVNQTAMEYIDVPLEEVIDTPFSETPWFDRSEAIQQEIEDLTDCAAGGEYVEIEVDLVGSDGDLYTVEGVFRPVTNDDGDVVSLLVSTRDITEQKEHKRELERVYEFFTEAERLGNLGAWEFDSTGDAVWTDGTRRIHEVDDDFEPTVENGIEFYHPDDRETIERAVEDALETGASFDVQARLITANGNERWIRTRGEPIDDRTHHRIRGYIQDITEQRHYEQELEHYREYTDRVFDAFNDLFFVFDRSGDLHRWNDSFTDVTGYSDEEIESMDGLELIVEEDRKRVAAAIQQVFETGHATLEASLSTKDGTEIPYELAADRVEHPQRGEYLVGLGRDISERKQRERELEQTREQTTFALDVTESVIWAIDLDTSEMIGYGPVERLIGIEPTGIDEFLRDVVHPDDRASVERVFEAVQDGDRDEFDVEFRTTSKTGETKWIASRGYVQESTDQYPDQLIGLATDVTDRLRRQKELQRQNDRLEEFTSVVSHDLRNPLHVAVGRLELLEDNCDSRHLEDLETALDRMDTLIDDLLTLAREGQQVGELETVDLVDLTRTCWQTVETADATLITETDRPIRADRSRLQQLLENLIRNAVEHGGTDVTVTVGELEDGFYLEDDGVGVPDCEDLFDAGYSTSENQKGFGLSIVKQVAEAHGWEIRVTDGSHSGARFEVTGVEFATD